MSAQLPAFAVQIGTQHLRSGGTRDEERTEEDPGATMPPPHQ